MDTCFVHDVGYVAIERGHANVERFAYEDVCVVLCQQCKNLCFGLSYQSYTFHVCAYLSVVVVKVVNVYTIICNKANSVFTQNYVLLHG